MRPKATFFKDQQRSVHRTPKGTLEVPRLGDDLVFNALPVLQCIQKVELTRATMHSAKIPQCKLAIANVNCGKAYGSWKEGGFR